MDDGLFNGRAHLDERKAQVSANLGKLRQREFHTSRTGFEKQRVVKGHQPILKGERRREVTFQACPLEVCTQPGATFAVTEMQPWPPWAM